MMPTIADCIITKDQMLNHNLIVTYFPGSEKTWKGIDIFQEGEVHLILQMIV